VLVHVAGFLQKLQTYDKDNIPPEVIVKIRPYMENPDFEPEVVKKASKAAYGLVSWVRAMEAYDRYSCSSVFCAFMPLVCSHTTQRETKSSSKQSHPSWQQGITSVDSINKRHCQYLHHAAAALSCRTVCMHVDQVWFTA